MRQELGFGAGAGCVLVIWEFPIIRCTLFGDPYNKDPTI